MTESANTRTRTDLAHAERLTMAWWGWLLPLTAAALLAAQVQFAYPAVPAWVPYVVLVPLAVAVVLALGRVRVRVETGDEPRLWVGGAHLPLRYVAAVDVVTKHDRRRALGPELDPAAFCVHKPWIGTMVRVHLDDPEDPTPYWLFSTRHPEKLAALLTDGSRGAASDDADRS